MKAVIHQTLNRLGYRISRVKPPFTPKIVHFDGGPVQFDYWIPGELYEGWYTESALHLEYDQLAKIVKSGDRVIEIGCNIGIMMMMLSHLVGKHGFVLGVDLVPENIIVAQSNAFLNMAANVKLLHAAIGASKREIGYANVKNGYVVEESPTRITQTTCDALDEEYGPFNVMKVDVEGYEASVLKGAPRLLTRSPNLALEIHAQHLGRYDATVAELIHLIDASRYKGQMYSRPDYRVRDFDPKRLDSALITNVFLEPKSDCA